MSCALRAQEQTARLAEMTGGTLSIESMTQMAIASRHLGVSYIGQDPLQILGSLPDEITSVRVSRPYGRFGNNFYQIANASIVATALGVCELQLPTFQFGPKKYPLRGGELILTSHVDRESCSVLAGSFYSPVGLEELFTGMPIEKKISAVREVAQAFYSSLIALSSAESRRTIVAHFRGGDVFDTTTTAPSWYVQPPAAFYRLALSHAWQTGVYDVIRLVAEDASNPALNLVVADLEAVGIPFETGFRSLSEDLLSLLSATCMISSFSTLPEAAAIMSKRLESVYSFRTHSSQTDFRPFTQSDVEMIMKAIGVNSFILDDATCSYIPVKTWTNSVEQLRIMAEYDIENLRIIATNFR